MHGSGLQQGTVTIAETAWVWIPCARHADKTDDPEVAERRKEELSQVAAALEKTVTAPVITEHKEV